MYYAVYNPHQGSRRAMPYPHHSNEITIPTAHAS